MKNNNGFSILEVMIALVISTVIISIVVMGSLAALRINEQSQDMRQAANLAEDKIEELRREAFSNIITGQDTLFYSEQDTVQKYFRIWKVTQISNKPRIKEVEVIIEWRDSKDRLHRSVFNTTFFRNTYPYKS